jgi:hypothetical protein
MAVHEQWRCHDDCDDYGDDCGCDVVGLGLDFGVFVFVWLAVQCNEHGFIH